MERNVALVHLHHSSGVERSSSPNQWVITWARRAYLYLRSEGRVGFAAAGAGKRDGEGLQLVSNNRF